jgi:hypothetical protein
VRPPELEVFFCKHTTMRDATLSCGPPIGDRNATQHNAA